MKITQLTPTIINTLISMLKSYNEIKADVPSEFLEDNLSLFSTNENEHFIIAELFLHITKHEKFLERFVLEYYNKLKRILQTDKYILIVFLYIILFLNNEDQLQFISNLLMKTSARKARQFVSFLTDDSTIMILTQSASCYFDQEYVRNVIMDTVLKDNEIFQKMFKIIKHARHKDVPKKKCTIPQNLQVLRYVCKEPRPPSNSSNKEFINLKTSKALDVPPTTYRKPSTQRKLQAAHTKNKEKAMELLRESQMLPAHLTQPLRPQEPEIPDELQTIPLVKAKPPPIFKEPEVPVKMNISSVLRHASRIVKEEEKEIERVKKLTVGALDVTLFENLYKELKQKEEQEHLQSIEKKHLKGLLTYEEAILAKRAIIQNNREKRELFEQQKKELEKQLKEFKQIEEEKIREIIQKTQQIQKVVDEKKRDLLDKKQKIVKEMSEVSRNLMVQLFKERTEELSRKIEMIKEIRTLSTFRKSLMRKKEFDDTETMNIGLMSEMSLAELYERLAMLRAEMREELEIRQQRIKKEKVRQQELLREMQNLIAYDQYERKKFNEAEPKNNAILQTDDEISMLRRKLEETREKRKKTASV